MSWVVALELSITKIFSFFRISIAGSRSGNLNGIAKSGLKGKETTGDIVEAASGNRRIAQGVGIGTCPQQAGNLLVGQHISQSVATQQVDIAHKNVGCHLDNVDKRCGAPASDTVGDNTGVFLGSQEVAERVVGGQLDQLVMTETVQTTVATVEGVILALVEGKGHQGGTHALILLIGTALRGHHIVDAVEPFHHQLIELAGANARWEVVIIELKIMEHIATGDIATIMTAHAVGNCDEKPLLVGQLNPGGESIIADEMVSHQYHVFILMSNTAKSAGCCYTYCYHSSLSDYDLQIEVGNREHITIA